MKTKGISGSDNIVLSLLSFNRLLNKLSIIDVDIQQPFLIELNEAEFSYWQQQIWSLLKVAPQLESESAENVIMLLNSGLLDVNIGYRVIILIT